MTICPRTGKHRHGSRAEARGSLAHLGYPKGASVFRCPHCGGWHWGHRTLPKRRQAVRR